jgi:hypothetical protein
MSIVSIPRNPLAAFPAPRDPPVIAQLGPMPSDELRAAIPTPLFTRHMLGVIEAERDRRGAFGATRCRPHPGRTAMAHPRLEAALAARALRITQARVDLSRWADEGGRFDPEAVGRLRIGDREMKRCNA